LRSYRYTSGWVADEKWGTHDAHGHGQTIKCQVFHEHYNGGGAPGAGKMGATSDDECFMLFYICLAMERIRSALKGPTQEEKFTSTIKKNILDTKKYISIKCFVVNSYATS